MTPMGALAVMFYTSLALAVIGTAALFIAKGTAGKASAFLMAAYAAAMAAAVWLSGPVNYLSVKIFAVIILLLSLSGLCVRLFLKDKALMANLLLIAGVFFGVAELFVL